MLLATSIKDEQPLALILGHYPDHGCFRFDTLTLYFMSLFEMRGFAKIKPDVENLEIKKRHGILQYSKSEIIIW